MPEVTAGDAHLALCAAVRGHLMPEVTAGGRPSCSVCCCEGPSDA